MVKPRTSIQNRLTLSLTFAIIALFGLSAVGLYFFMRHAFYQQFDKNLMRVAEDFIHETGRNSNGDIECEFHELDLEEFRKGPLEGAAYYQLWNHRGETLILSDSLTNDDSLPYQPVAIGHFETQPIMLAGMFSGRVLYVSFPLKLDGHGHHDEEDASQRASQTPGQKAFVESYDKNAPANRVYLAIAEDPADLRRTLLILGSALFVTGLILAGTTFLLVRKIVLSACRPIVEIAQITEQMGPDNLNSLLPDENVPIELLPLIVKFNQFIKRLDDAIRRERRFSIGLAHELRTPVAEIRSLMEVAADTIDKRDEDSQDNSYEIYQRGAIISQRMSKLIEVLTVIHQDNSTAIQLTSEPVSIASILQQSIDGFDPQTQTRFRFDAKNTDCKKIATDPDLLRAIIDNLLINGSVHSPDHSEITVHYHANGFTIRNTTNDLTENDLSLFKEAFWQKDSARTDANRFGLGLTLVTVYLRLLGGSIEHSLKNGELTTKVTLPDQANQS